MMKKYCIVLVVLFFSASSLYSQNVSDLLVKNYLPNSYWLTLRYDHYLKTNSFLYFENNNRFNQQPVLGESFPFNSIYRMHFMAGYEHKASDNWYLGLSQRIVLTRGRNSFYSRVNMSHRGKLFKLKFHKEAAFEYLKYPGSDNPNIIVNNEGRVSFAPSLIKDLTLFDRKLYFVLSYRAFVIFDFVNDGYSSYDKRTIDKTRLRVEADYFLSKRLMVSLFAIRETDYSYQIALFDGSMNLISPEARANRITPTYGLSLNYVFNAPEDFLPGFPIK